MLGKVVPNNFCTLQGQPVVDFLGSNATSIPFDLYRNIPPRKAREEFFELNSFVLAYLCLAKAKEDGP